MNQSNTPKDILALIQIAEEEQVKESDAKKAAALAEDEKARQETTAETLRLVEKVEHLIPDDIFPFLIIGSERTGGHGDSCWWEKVLEFQIPGLAPIGMIFTGLTRDDEEPKHSHWIVAGVSDFDWDQDTDICKTAGFSFRSGVADKVHVTNTNIREVLWLAKKTFEAKEDRQIELDQSIVRYHKRIEKRKQEEAQQVAEEEALFDAIKNDPIAIHMLKAFILLRDERSTFEQRLENMGEEMYSMEDRWSRKAADLRRQVDDTERRARDEQSRLQSDLEDAEAKLARSFGRKLHE